MDYKRYIASARWKRRRRRYYRRFGKCCAACRTDTDPITLHHMSYESRVPAPQRAARNAARTSCRRRRIYWGRAASRAPHATRCAMEELPQEKLSPALNLRHAPIEMSTADRCPCRPDLPDALSAGSEDRSQIRLRNLDLFEADFELRRRPLQIVPCESHQVMPIRLRDKFASCFDFANSCGTIAG